MGYAPASIYTDHRPGPRWRSCQPARLNRVFPLLAVLVSTACPEGCTDVLASVTDPMMDFSLSYFTKGRLLKLSNDLSHTSTQLGRADHSLCSVRVNYLTGRVDHPAHVLILTTMYQHDQNEPGQ
ncbi:hypothetical protein F2Q68_00016460 [Brassica cretica]|uniref:Uncharacterized protein n=1 Tax=Brassica cretica TaxID=69181 RepID=A0A8S9HNV0_BRACR|nr:hypothetical protein F2Q68_00016460 [Brassica cretica]